MSVSPTGVAQVVPACASASASGASASVQDHLVCFVNGKKHVLKSGHIQPEMTLLQFLRNTCGLSGTKLVCGEGGCGACTVLLSRFDVASNAVVNLSVNACLFPLGGVDGAHIITVEGIGNPKIGLHPIQLRLAELNGSQCGFCTPGIVMAFYALVRNNPNPTSAEIEHVMDGNLCRCTGYRPILDATKSFAADRSNGCGMGANCCRNKKPAAEEQAASSCSSSAPACASMKLNHSCTCSKIAELASVTEPVPLAFKEDTALIFPPFLRSYALASHARIELRTPECVWTRPADLHDLLVLKSSTPSAKLVCGNTEAGIDMKFRQDSRPWSSMYYISDLQELTFVSPRADGSGVEFGAGTTINNLARYCKQHFAQFDAASKQIATAILSQVHWFAGTQIRNVATISGNICTASPISDLNPVWQSVAGATMRVQKVASASADAPVVERVISAQSFWTTKYRQTSMTPDEILVGLFVPLRMESSSAAAAPVKHVFTHAYKQSRRRADDIAIVTASLQIGVEVSGSALVFSAGANLSYGGMAPSTMLAARTAAFLAGKPFSLATITAASQELKLDYPLLDAVVLPGGMAEYRMVLAASFLLKMFYFMWRDIAQKAAAGLQAQQMVGAFPEDAASAAEEYEREISSGSQSYKMREIPAADAHPPATNQAAAAAAATVPAAAIDPHEAGGDLKLISTKAANRTLVGDPTDAPAQPGESLRHMSALKQTTGEAKYVDDIPAVRGELFGALVLSTEAHARIVSIDTSALEAHPAYLGFWSAKDVPGSNSIGDIIKDEELFASEEVVCVGTMIGAVVGRTHIEAMQLAKLVKISYEKLPAIFTIDEAIAAGSYIAPWAEGHFLEHGGDVTEALAKAPRTLEGEARIGGQEHFYLETCQSLATPGEGDEMFVTGTTQNPNKTQEYVARVLGIGAHKVVCSVKRMGGAFGGKETRTLSLFAANALLAKKTGQTVRLLLDRDTDMCITGQRHAFVGKYKVGFEPSGKIVAADVRLYANAGCSADLTMPVVDRALFHVDNAYNFGAVRFKGYPCKTNLPSNTAFRGFGGPQGMFVGENIVDAVAHALHMLPEEVRRVNLYQEGDITPYKQQLTEYTVPEQFAHVMSTVNVSEKRREIARFNQTHEHRKRGLAVIPTKFGISFTAKFLNQAGALVLVYADGTVLVSHGGTEMGQGLHTKMTQVAASCFNIPVSMVTVGDTATDKVANASATAASASSDLNGAAVMDACNQILARLAPVRKAHPHKSWRELCSTAYFDRIQLTATGFYATPNVGYDFVKHEGTPFNYFTTGVSYSEVEVDTLTGDSCVLSTVVVMDVGSPINPSLDIGQIEGALLQGLGLFTLEELVWGDSAHPWVRPGALQTRGPGTYKLPTANDVPIRLHIDLWKGGRNSKAIFSSKGVGEPPLFMAASVFFAIKDALTAARTQNLGDTANKQPFVLHSPATAERIRMATADKLCAAFIRPDAAAEAAAAAQTDDAATAAKQRAAHFQTLGSF